MPPYHQANGEGESLRPEGVSTMPSRDVRRVGKGRMVVEALIAGLALVILSPLLLVVAVAVKLTSSGPALFKQERIGRDGKPFHIWKFRTMVVDADRQLQALLAKHNRGNEPLFKVPDDPRITPLGRFLRKTSLDELPQLFNVVRGDMAFIGPRPQRADEVALYTPRQYRRLALRPGITGLWQVNGRSDLPWEQAVELDLQYVETRSLRMDLQILVKTFVVVFTRRGAE